MADLQTFPNPRPGRADTIPHHSRRFTALGSRTGQPDFATMRSGDLPNARCVGLKSRKLPLLGLREAGAFREAVVDEMLDEPRDVVPPRRLTLERSSNVHGRISSRVQAGTAKRRVRRRRRTA